MKIAILITHPDNIGGGHVYVKNLASALQSRGHTIRVFVGQRGPFTEMLASCRIPFNSLSHLQRPINLLKDYKAVLEIRKHLVAYSPDLVSCHSTKAGLLGRITARLTGIPSVFTAHGWVFSDGTPPVRRSVYQWAEILAARLGNHVITVSEYDRQLAIQSGISKHCKVVTVLNGIPDTATRDSRRRHLPPVRLVMVARLALQKNHAGLLRSLARLAHLDWTVDFIGDGPLSMDLPRLSKELGIAERTRFHGYIDDPAAILASSDVFILHTHWEGMPLSILEAMRAGLPVIATDTGGVSEAVRDGETGFLIPRNDNHLLETQLTKLVTNQEYRLRLGKAGRARYQKHFTLDRMITETLAVFQEAVREP